MIYHWIALPSPFVLRKSSIYFFFLIADRDRTVSQRSEPSSRITFISEQLNPWNHIQLQDVMSRHRGAKPLCWYGLLRDDKPVIPRVPFIRWAINLPHGITGSLWPTYFIVKIKNTISVRYVCLTVKQCYTITYSNCNKQLNFCHCAPTLRFSRLPPQPNYPIYTIYYLHVQ